MKVKIHGFWTLAMVRMMMMVVVVAMMAMMVPMVRQKSKP
jgi:type IV secretory pathway component VirB8